MYPHNDVEEGAGPLLSDGARRALQCNVINSTERIRSRQVFVSFATRDELIDWLRQQQATSEKERGTGDQDANVLLTHAGLAKLGVSQETLGRMDSAFRRGARAEETVARLRDPSPATWTSHEEPWDAALLVHSDNGLQIALPQGRCVVEHGNSLDGSGNVIPNRANAARRFNVFGYLDGISVNHYDGGAPEWTTYNPNRQLSTLLVADPFAARSNGTAYFGSYFVFRKYEQNVYAFNQKIERIARTIEEGLKDPNRMQVGKRFPFFDGVVGDPLRAKVKAWLMGRTPAGARLPLPDGNESSNDFDYKSDPEAKHCPFHAHIAKMNPRGRTGDVEQERKRSMARRGISFGSRTTAQKGLLFWCAQASIAEQFEYIQQHWANDDKVDLRLEPTPDLDNIVGKRKDAGTFEITRDPYPPGVKRYDRWKNTIDADFGIYDTISLKASEYFYAPSLPGIQALVGGV